MTNPFLSALGIEPPSPEQEAETVARKAAQAQAQRALISKVNDLILDHVNSGLCDNTNPETDQLDWVLFIGVEHQRESDGGRMPCTEIVTPSTTWAAGALVDKIRDRLQ